MLILRLIYAIRENLRVLMKKIAFRRIQEKNRGQTEPQKSQRKDTKDARPCRRAARPCCSGRKPLQWRTATRTAVRVTMCPRTASRACLHSRASSGRSEFMWFHRFFTGNFSYFVLFAFGLQLELWIHSFWIAICDDSTIIRPFIIN